MSSSTRGRVIKAASHTPTAPLDLDLSTLPQRIFDPSRIEEAVAEGYRVGFAGGHADGLAAGVAEGRSTAVADLSAARRQLGAVLVALRDQLHAVAGNEQALLRAVEDAIADAAIELAESIVGRAVAAATDPGRDAIARALELAPTGVSEAVVRLHPADAENLGDLGELSLGRLVTVVADETIEPGGCVLETGDCSIDAQLGPALARARALLAGS